MTMSNADSGLPAHAVATLFEFLPAYAGFLLDQKLAAFSETTMRISRELQMPLLRYFEAMPEAELKALSMEGSRKLLRALAENRAEDYVSEPLRTWRENQLPLIQNDDVVIEDISKGNFARRKAFRDLLTTYTQDASRYIALMEEVDRFTLINEDASLKMLFELKESKMREHHHFIDKISNASPGIIYVYNIETLKQVYSNHRLEEMLGYTGAAMAALQSEGLDKLVYPDDRERLAEHRQILSQADDAGMHALEFRILSHRGIYVWQRCYESVFKRDTAGLPSEIIGIAIDISEEKEASIQLEQREQQLREAQEIAGMGSFEWDIQGQGTVLSAQLLQIFELEARSNLPDFLQYVHPADLNSVKAALAGAMTGEGHYECEYRYRKHGAEKVIWSRGRVVFQDGQPMRMKGTVMDVTQRHDMLKRLARSEQLHKQAQALTQLGNWSWSLIDDRVEWSDEMYRIFGLTPQSEAMTLGRILSFVHPEDRERQRLTLHNALSTRLAEDYTMRLVSADGILKYVDGKSEVLCDDEGQPYKIVGTIQDVTRQHQLNERLKENEAASRHLINNAPEAIVVIDENSHILLWNPKAESVFGWSLAEIQGRTLMETIIPPAYRAAHSGGVLRLQAGGESRVLNKTIEVEALRSNGDTFFISLTISRSLRGGKPVYIAFIRDVTEEKAVALKLEEQRAQLAQKNRALERSNEELMAFNYIASHDLKEPVRKIKLFSNIVAGNGALTPSAADAMSRIIASAEHMERLIEALILFSRIDSGAPRMERINLDSLLAGTLQLLKDRIEEAGARITSGPLPDIVAMPFQIAQLFENLIGNALKYSKPGMPPRITVTSARVTAGDIADAGMDVKGLFHRISISDNGIGFDQQYASRIFEVFQRLHSKGTYSGTGIGLAICKKIVQRHDGFINAQSEPGIGATFNIYLPDHAPLEL